MGMVKVLERRRLQREENCLDPEMEKWERRFMHYTQTQLNLEAKQEAAAQAAANGE